MRSEDKYRHLRNYNLRKDSKQTGRRWEIWCILEQYDVLAGANRILVRYTASMMSQRPVPGITRNYGDAIYSSKPADCDTRQGAMKSENRPRRRCPARAITSGASRAANSSL